MSNPTSGNGPAGPPPLSRPVRRAIHPRQEPQHATPPCQQSGRAPGQPAQPAQPGAPRGPVQGAAPAMPRPLSLSRPVQPSRMMPPQPVAPMTPSPVPQAPYNPYPQPYPQILPQPQVAPPLPYAAASGAMTPTIAVRGLVKRFETNNFALSIPQLDIFPGELTYIGGPSGSGKSTLIKMLSLETTPDSGDMWILDRHVRSLTPHERDDLRGGGMTYLPQTHLGLTDHTPVEVIQRLLHDYDGVPWEQGARKAEMALQTVRLPPKRFHANIRDLSGGERARVAIAKAYAAERPICLADEILPALDEATRIVIIDLFQFLANDGFTVVIIAHQPNLMDRFHRVIEVKDGQIVNDVRKRNIVSGPGPAGKP